MNHPDRIFLAVCKAFSVDPLVVWSHSRTRMASYPRMVAAYLMREMTPMTMEDITLYLNRTDHSTAHYWVKTAKQMAESELYRSLFQQIKEDLSTDGESSRPAPDLQGRHPILREGSRHTRRGHRLQRILQFLPSEGLAEPRQADGEGGGDPQAD